MHRLCNFLQLILNLSILNHCNGALSSPKQRSLSFDRYSKCTYSYEVSIHTARGAQSTASDGYQVHALVSFSYMYFLYFPKYRSGSCSKN